MGLYTSVRLPGNQLNRDEVQFVTGTDCCKWYDIGDSISEGHHSEVDGVYPGIALREDRIFVTFQVCVENGRISRVETVDE
jgi:hypothetical protein